MTETTKLAQAVEDAIEEAIEAAATAVPDWTPRDQRVAETAAVAAIAAFQQALQSDS
jgi:hypothetical protein